MELVSVRAGEPWSDHPKCVHPVLAAVARAVNDRVSDACRARLGCLAPVLAGTASDDVRVSARLVIVCVDATHHPDADLIWARRTAHRILLRPAGPSRGIRSYQRRAAGWAAYAVACVPGRQRDEKLVALLCHCTRTARSTPANGITGQNGSLLANAVSLISPWKT